MPLPYSVRSARHHFRNHLGVIRGFSELTLERLDPESSSYCHLEFMIQSCDRLQKFIDRVLCSEEILKRVEWRQPFWVNLEYDMKSIQKSLEALFIIHQSDSNPLIKEDLSKMRRASEELLVYAHDFMKSV